ncbi:MAG: hypothetical protein JNM96_01950 [Bacteroidia bacterium]|nr:hypothetical protein [Bacteroidia bacterium]
MKKLIYILFFLFSFSFGRAQFLDSLNLIFRSKSSIDARFESRFSVYKTNLIEITGVRLGVAYKRRLRIGGGVSWLKTNLKTTTQIRNQNGELEEISRYLKLAYLCYYIDFVFHRTKRWQLSVPIQVGTGASWFQRDTKYDINNKDPKYFLLLYEPGITIQFKVFKWLGAGGDIAQRFVLRNYKKTSDKLFSPTFSVKALFWPDQLFYQVFPENEISKKFGPAEW